MSARISISDARALARRHPGELGDACLALIDVAESLRREHADECGCDWPGTGFCSWPRSDGHLLASFDFDEEVIAP